MLEKSSWCQTPDGVLPASCDSDSLKIASSDTGMSSHCLKNTNIKSGSSEFGVEGPNAIDNDSCRYPLSHIVPQLDNDISFFDNDCDNKESSDLLDYEWPDFGNFEDVDHMFRSCDSTFGIGSAANGEELSWLSSLHAFEGPEDNSGFKFSCSDSKPLKSISKNCNDSFKTNNEFASSSCCRSSQTSDYEDPAALVDMPFVNGMSIISEYKDEFPTREQGNLYRKPSLHQKQPEGNGHNCCLDNGFSDHPSVKLKQAANIKLSYGDSPYKNVPFSSIQQEKHNVGSDTKKHAPSMQSDNSHTSDQNSSSPTITSMKIEKDCCTILSEEFSFASSHVKHLKSSHNPSSKAAPVATQQKREMLQQGLQSSSTNLTGQGACYETNSSENIIYPFNTDVEDHREVKGGIDTPTELDSSNLQESSCMSSVFNDFSPEEASFRQLLYVMEKLNLRTKLCIRDSLYRLARSAEERHDGSKMDCGSRDDSNSSEEFKAKTNDCAGFMDMETDTNPIDRSIAHLLFHRPSDPSGKSANDDSALKPCTLIKKAAAHADKKANNHR